MISPIGNNYSYYTTGYVSGSTIGAARTAMAESMNSGISSVSQVEDTPEVFSNEETERIQRSPKEMEADRRTAYEIMSSLTPRNAEALNAPLHFLPNSPFTMYSDTKHPDAEQLGIEQPDMEQSESVDESEECETCKERTYVDVSNESDVSFQTPGHIAPESAAGIVAAHEYEHVANAIQEGNKPDAKLISVSVSLKTAICPECGKTYVSGGETKTAIRYQKPNPC